MSKSCQLSVSHINIVHGDEILLATKETSTPTLYTYFRNFNDPSENGYPSFHSDAGNGKTRHEIFAQDGAAFKTFFPKELDIKRPGGICSLAQLVVRVMLFTSL